MKQISKVRDFCLSQLNIIGLKNSIWTQLCMPHSIWIFLQESSHFAHEQKWLKSTKVRHIEKKAPDE